MSEAHERNKSRYDISVHKVSTFFSVTSLRSRTVLWFPVTIDEYPATLLFAASDAYEFTGLLVCAILFRRLLTTHFLKLRPAQRIRAQHFNIEMADEMTAMAPVPQVDILSNSMRDNYNSLGVETYYQQVPL